MPNIVYELFFYRNAVWQISYGDACLHGCLGWSDQIQCQKEGYYSTSYPLQGTN
jgi:hypothetical protein